MLSTCVECLLVYGALYKKIDKTQDKAGARYRDELLRCQCVFIYKHTAYALSLIALQPISCVSIDLALLETFV